MRSLKKIGYLSAPLNMSQIFLTFFLLMVLSFGQANQKNIDTVITILDEFHSHSRLRVNLKNPNLFSQRMLPLI